ncbi:MAG: ABC-F family ATP-binding cassette domain-containing protein [Acidimicrobiia bacterium]|nr:ABC-F family ATP-binding cassette domain-containing protein [Acidimicrobiia bacterium]
MICVDLAGVGVAQPDKVLFADVAVTIHRGDRVAVVGVNGSGKTTLLRILDGSLDPDDGVARFGRGVRIASLEQDPTLPAGTVRQYLGGDHLVAAAATSLGVQPLFERPTDELSGGQAKRVALAKVLADDQHGHHDLLVLDEPTNHLDLEAIEWLEQRLRRLSAALVIVTHDRHLLDLVTTDVGPSKVVELDAGRAYVHQALAGRSAYAATLDARATRIVQQAKAESTRKVLARQELAWLRRGAPARSSKPKARLRSAAEIVSGGPSGRDIRDSDLDLGYESRRLGNQGIELESVGQRFGDHLVLDDVNLVIEPGARLAVVGANGSGKTTLLDLIAGRSEPTAGRITRGKTVVVGYADQHSAALDPDAVVREIVAGPYRQPDHEDRALLERFWFDTPAQFAPVRMLSGGERRRLVLVTVLAAKPNVLVLDEPTNDLDLDTLRALEVFFDEWPGALVAASHDRAFLDRVADHVIAVGDGRIRRVPGGVAGGLAERDVERASAALATTRSSHGNTRAKKVAAGPSPSTIGRRLRETEQAMVKAQRRVEALTDELATVNEHQDLQRIGEELTAAQGELDNFEERWLELAELQDG